MRGADISALTAFVTVAEHRSFRGAATRLGVTPSALSHTIRQLEERFGVRLLNRTTRSMSLTDAGARLVERIRPAMDQIFDAVEGLNTERERPRGTLRVHAHGIAAASVIAPVWERFLSTHPQVDLEVRVDHAMADIVALGFDARIAARREATPNMVAVQVFGPLRIAVVGAPSYFAQRPPPTTPQDLAQHDCVKYRGGDAAIQPWHFEHAGRTMDIGVGGRVIVNDPELAIRAAVDGLGVAYTAEALVVPFLRSGQLVRVLADWSPSSEGLFLYYPSHRQIPAVLRAFIDLIRESSSSKERRQHMTSHGRCLGGSRSLWNHDERRRDERHTRDPK
jgi:DNA-binding transcriptional LysR family regulator